ncbi:MAG: hypothetical protein KJO07_15755, partial [Deltaproteobacteria bacterium]|nr:hypothetical protein [Deltaproteobacteria bacterium]
VLSSRGVNIDNETVDSAGALFRSSQQALGAPNYGARSREASAHTSASAQRMFDIFLAAAPEVIASMPTLEACTLDGAPTEMFDDSGNCIADGVACLTGVMPTAAHLEICNQTIVQASSPEKGRAIAVAALLSAAHTCE